jgi:hypothetical protein
MSRDSAEAFINAVVGLAISTAAVWLLRASGAWVTAPAWAVALLFFGMSYARLRALRWVFRRGER